MKKLLIAFVLSVALSLPAFGLDLPEWVTDYEMYALYLRTNFEYKYEENLYGYHEQYKSPTTTLTDKGGDCEDFAILSNKVLTNLEYESYIITIKRKGHTMLHVICVFKDNHGMWRVFNNQYLETGVFSTRKDAILNYNPYLDEVIKIWLTTPEKYGWLTCAEVLRYDKVLWEKGR